MGAFKVKKWAKYRAVDMRDFVPDIQTGMGGAGSTRGWAMPYRGYVMVMAYDSEGGAIWGIYDPGADSFDGPYASTVTNWAGHSDTFGWNTWIVPWRDHYLLGVPQSVAYYFARESWWGWTDLGSHYNQTMKTPGYTYCYVSEGRLGMYNGEPCVASWQFNPGDQANQRMVLHTPSGKSIVHQGPVYIPTISGSSVINMVYWEGVWEWNGRFYSHVPETSSDAYIATGSVGTLTPHPTQPYGYAPVTIGGNTFWARTDSILSEAAPDWDSAWDYRRTRDGLAYALEEQDLDGQEHDAVLPCGEGEYTYSSGVGWYFTLDSTDPVLFNVYALDPHQPTSRPHVTRRAFSAPVAWVGEYAIGEDLKLDHILPFPDSRTPVGMTRPPQVHNDGYLLGAREVFQQTGSAYTYKRDVLVDLSAYPTNTPDWWWPGSDGDHYDGMWELFAGQPTIVGRMPDPNWGTLTPMGQDITMGLGTIREDLKAEAPAPTHFLSEGGRIANTGFVSYIPGALTNRRREIRAVPGDDRLCYTESGTMALAPPAWTARVGRIANRIWTTLIDFDSMDTPGLGETDWTIWSVVPIPKCRALPQGGFLVGATLYFDPWSDWEYTRGEGTTFHYKNGPDTGNSWMPAKPGNIGPLPIDYHMPVLLSAYDEWTIGRSLYGPDALLVYDNDGEFVECLNNDDFYPPDGREIVVVGERVPRVIYRIYRHGTYSDYAEGWGQYHGGGEYDVQAPLYCCYDLESGGKIQPGAGSFRGFVDMYRVRDYAPKDVRWRWDTVAPNIYAWEYPKIQWNPPGSSYVREGIGGSGITLLSPTGYRSKLGVKQSGRS